MIYISHRGNLIGSDIKLENTIYGIEKCLTMNLDIEIDVWLKDNNLYLGHDYPKNKISIDILKNKKIWCHAKNIDALLYLSQYNDIHYFWHENDTYTITSKQIIWAYPGMPINSRSICVKPELHHYSGYELSTALGICSDNILYYIQYANTYL